MSKEGYRESTISTRVKALKQIMKNCNILDAEDFKTFLANKQWSDGTKSNAVDVYRCYARYKEFKAENMPNYYRETPLPFIPLEKEIDNLISGCGKKTSTFLQLLKETAFRPIEALRLKWTDLDSEMRVVNLTKPAKHSKPRQPKISSKLLSMLLSLSHDFEYIFATHEPSEKDTEIYARASSDSEKTIHPPSAKPQDQMIDLYAEREARLRGEISE
ncbi:MAG: tyrosine-type recombinase/integrase [Candidatus Bathyarchaeota archaeon]